MGQIFGIKFGQNVVQFIQVLQPLVERQKRHTWYLAINAYIRHDLILTVNYSTQHFCGY
jgi:hypothetical protein